MKLNNKQVCVCRGDRWELISVALVAVQPAGRAAYATVLQRYIDDPAGREPNAVGLGRNRYAVSRRVLSRKELLGMPIPIDWLK